MRATEEWWVQQQNQTPNTFTVMLFLVADTQLYKRLCPAVGLLVCWSIHNDWMEWNWKKSVLDTFCVCLCVGCRVEIGVWIGAGCSDHPYATILWPRVSCLSIVFRCAKVPVKSTVSVGWSAGRVTHWFDDPPGAPYWPPSPCYFVKQFWIFRTYC